MKIKLSIKSKLIYFILITSMLVYTLGIGYLIIKLKISSLEDAKRLVEESIKTGAKELESELNTHMGVARALAYTISNFESIPFEERDDTYGPILKKTLEENPNYIASYYTLQLSDYDPYWGNNPGRESKIYYRDNNQINYNEIRHDVGGVKKRTGYHKIMDSKKEGIWEPYWCETYDVNKEKVLETTLGVPILKEGKFIGLAGIDIELSVFDEIIDKIKPFEGGYAYLVSNEGTYVTHPDKELIGTKFYDENPEEDKQYKITEKIKNGENFSIDAVHSTTNEDLYVKFVPVQIANTETPWSLTMLVPINSIMVNTNKIIRVSIIAGIFGLVILFLVITSISKSIIKPIESSVEFAQKITAGDLRAKLNSNSHDELGQLSGHLETMADKFREIVEMIKESGNKINEASFQLYRNSEQLTEGANSQVSATEQVSTSMQEMASNIHQNAENAQQTETLSNNAARSVIGGSNIALEATGSMKKIAEKISIIGEISSQTNILALNAAVEAARAGDHGKGFAVVAAEVRKLAERSKIAADDIDELIKVSIGTSLTAEKQFKDIVPEIEKTAVLVQEISTASMEQNTGVDQINHSMQSLNGVAHTTLEASNNISENSKELAEQAEKLSEIIQFFKI